jgi:hypothetical protein
MKGVAQNNLRTHLMQAALHQTFHSAIGSHWHEDRRLHHAVIQRERASAGVRGFISFEEFEVKHAYLGKYLTWGKP